MIIRPLEFEVNNINNKDLSLGNPAFWNLIRMWKYCGHKVNEGIVETVF